MALVMIVDRMKYKWFGIAILLSIIFLIFTIIFGILGPNQRINQTDYAYKCQNNSHEWNSDSCAGVQLGSTDLSYWHELPSLGKLNSLWKVTMYPYNINNPPTDVEEIMEISVSIFGKQEEDSDWYSIASQSIISTYLICTEDNEECLGVEIIFDNLLQFQYYAIRVSLPNTSNNQETRAIVGDVAFVYEWINANFSIESIVLRLFYLFVSAFIFIIFIYIMNQIPRAKWSIEQRLIFVLHISLILMNNPVYIFEFFMPGSFFPMLDSFFIVIEQVTLLLVWLILFDYMRKGEIVIQYNRFDILKPFIVSTYAILAFSLFSWFRIADITNPVIGENDSSMTYFVIFFVLTTVFYSIILLWVIILMSIAISIAIQEKGIFFNRLLLLGTSSLILMTSMIINILFGNFGPINHSAVSFVFFFSINNLYIWILTLGYWPYKYFGFKKIYSLIIRDANNNDGDDDDNNERIGDDLIISDSEDAPIFPPSVENNFNL